MKRHDTHDTTSNNPPRRRARLGIRLSPRLGLSRVVACAAVATVLASVPVAAGSRADNEPGLPTPTGLRTFLKTLGDTRQTSATGIPEFARTPAFAWTPIRGATKYEFELSTSPATSSGG